MKRITAWSTLRTLWQQRTRRERRLLTLGGALLLAGVLWSALLAPAWRTWQQAPEQQTRLEAQTRHMLRLQAEAQALQTPQRLSRADVLLRLKDSAQALLGPAAQLQEQGPDLRVTLQHASARGLAQWLAQAREVAQTRPNGVQLERPAPANTADAAEPTEVTWSGTLVLRLP